MSDERANIYAALIEHGALPIVPHQPGDTAKAYLDRAIAALGEQYADVTFDVELFPIEPDPPSHEAYDRIGVSFTVEQCQPLDACALSNDLYKLHPRLPISLFERLRDASNGTFDVVTPTAALEIADMMMFYGDHECWWEELRGEVSYERERAINEANQQAGLPETAPGSCPKATNADIRRYIRQSGARTPGQIRKAIGRHFVPGKRERRRRKRDDHLLSKPEIVTLLDSGSDDLRNATLSILDAIERMDAISKRFRKALATDDDDLYEHLRAEGPTPGRVINVDHFGTVTDILEEHWQYVIQGESFGANHWIVIDATPESCKRFARTFADFAIAQQAMTAIDLQITAYSEASPSPTNQEEDNA